MTRKKCRKLIMAAGVQRNEVNEYLDNLLPELGSYNKIFINTVQTALSMALEEAYTKSLDSCYVRYRA